MDLVHLIVKPQKPAIVTYHSDIVKQKKLLWLYKPLMNRFLKSIDIIVATSENYRVTSDILQEFQDKTEVIPIGLEKNLYPTIENDKSEYWLNILGPKFFLFVGVLRYYKGLNTLLQALAIREFPVVIIGAGPIESGLKALAKKLSLKNLVFLGQLSEVDKVAIINLSYAIVFPSNLRSEAFGISLLEGAMYGKPMISSEIGTGTSFININNETGLVVTPNSPSALSDAMFRLWNSPELAQKMGHKASERFANLFTAKQMCKSYVNLYQRVINKRFK
jgi:rhamnosyl/mannosyltransferase